MRTVYFVLIFLSFGLNPAFGKTGSNPKVHPRGLIQASQVEGLRQKAQREPFRSMMSSLKNYAREFEQKSVMSVSDSSAIARTLAYLYILSGEKANADRAWNYAKGVLYNQSVFNNPVSRGLDRATLLRNMAETYDLCFSAWSEEQCHAASERLIFATIITASNMGYDANYSMESNWMGIRYSAVLLASIIADDWLATDKLPSRLLPFEWDATNRLREHLSVNINSNGWNTESISYFAYGWTFVGPALIALQNKLGESNFSLEKNVPNAVHALWGYSTATVSIAGVSGKVMQPDFSDDDPMSSYYLVPLGLRLFPENQKPALLWMLNYLSGPDTWTTDGEQLFYNILWSPENIQPENPAKAGWLTYFDADQGMALFRNRFQDENDIVAGFTATAKRVRGHQGFDNLGFRILGLGSIWAVGAGRTDQVAGQTTLFPSAEISRLSPEKGALGRVLSVNFENDGSGEITATGSCMGVKNHRRTFQVDYSKNSGVEAVFVVSDRSENGSIWRMNSPEFNSVQINPDGFTLISPQGAELKATVFTDQPHLNISTGKVRYGGETKRLNRGIEYRGISYSDTHAIDCKTNGNITVVLTLQPKGRKHPRIERLMNGDIRVGARTYKTN